MTDLIKTVNQSKKNVIEKAVYLAQEIWLHQPFVDGNKRTGRLLINFLLMKEGYPLFSFDLKNENYNNLLVTQYIEGKENLVIKYVTNKLITEMKEKIKLLKGIKSAKKGGFRMMI